MLIELQTAASHLIACPIATASSRIANSEQNDNTRLKQTIYSIEAKIVTEDEYFPSSDDRIVKSIAFSPIIQWGALPPTEANRKALPAVYRGTEYSGTPVETWRVMHLHSLYS